MKDLAIALTVWCPPGPAGGIRASAALKATESWFRNFRGVDSLHLAVADDGSADTTHLTTLRSLAERYGASVTISHTDRRGQGGALNAAVTACLAIADTVSFQQDDWELTEPLDLGPSLALLRDAYGDIVRVGMTHPNLAGLVLRTPIPDAEWVLQYLWSGGGYVVGFRPALWHRRVFEAHGYFDPDVSAVECERLYCERVKNKVTVLHAPNATLGGAFQPLETVELGEDTPETLTARYAQP